MSIVSMTLDPNAASYTDDEIVAKVNAASAAITRASAVSADALADGTTNKAYTATEKTKLTGIEASATADQTGAEVQTAILGLADADRRLIKTSPGTGEFYVLNVQRDATGKLDIDYESVAKS